MPEPEPPYLHWDHSDPTAVQILRRAHDLVAFGWCQHADAMDADRRPVHPWSSRACSWSLLGALVAALDAPNKRPETPELIAELRLALVALSETIGAWSLQDWNDATERTQTEVAETLAAARQRCVAKQSAAEPNT